MRMGRVLDVGRRSLARSLACLSLPLLLAIGSPRPELARADSDEIQSSAEPLPRFVPGSFTIAVLPDTQKYVRNPEHLHHFNAQCDWIAANAANYNIKYVLHLGDITNDNTEEQWTRARDAMSRLERADVPFALVPGNHDFGSSGSSDSRATKLNTYFSQQRHAQWPTFGGAMEEGRLENTYHMFSAGGHDYLVLALEWGPRDHVLDWANRVVRRHAAGHQAQRVILVTHAFLYHDNRRYDWTRWNDRQRWSPHDARYGGTRLDTNDGQEIWDKLVRWHEGFVMTLNGHVLEDGLGRRASLGEHGNVVHQMLVNYQMKPEGGEGYMRLLEFRPDGRTVVAKSWSPSVSRSKVDAQNQFTMRCERAPVCVTPGGAPSNMDVTPLFTRGRHSDPDPALRDKLISLIDGTKAGCNIRFSVYRFYYAGGLAAPLPAALVRAADRGAHVEILADDRGPLSDESRRAHRRFHSALDARLKRAFSMNAVIRHPQDRKDHNKFFLFSSSGGRRSWVVLGSENLAVGSTKKHQASLVFRDQVLYDAFDAFWEGIKEGTWRKDDPRWKTTSGQLRSYFFPLGHDVVEKIFSSFLSPQRSGEILICMPRWSTRRARRIAESLRLLRDSGYVIRIITRSDSDSVPEAALEALRGAADVRAVSHTRFNIHSKFIVLKGRYGRSGRRRVRRIVWTGSENLTNAALSKNYESMVRCEVRAAYDAYRDHFYELWGQLD